MAARRQAKLLGTQLEALQQEFPQCRVSDDQYKATLNHWQLPTGSFLTLELQLQPSFKAFVTSVQPASGLALSPEQLRHHWMGARGELDQRVFAAALVGRSDDLRRVVRMIIDEFSARPPMPAENSSMITAAAAGPPPTYGHTQAPLPTYGHMQAPMQTQAPLPTYSQALPSYQALQPAPAVGGGPAPAAIWKSVFWSPSRSGCSVTMKSWTT